MSWTTVHAALLSLFSTLAVEPGADPALPEFRAEWMERHQDLIHVQEAFGLYLKITTVAGLGQDERRYGIDGFGNRIEVLCGMRRVTLNVQAVVTEYTDELWAMAVLERVRTRLHRSSSHAALDAANCSLINVGGANDASSRFDDRILSIASFDVLLHMAVNDVDPVPAGYIAFLLLTSKVQDVSGEELPAPPNVVDDPLPQAPP